MKRVVVDTDILIDYAHGYAKWLENILVAEDSLITLVLPTIVIAEYFTSMALDDPKEVGIADRTFTLFFKQDLTEDIAKVLGALLRHKTHAAGASLADLIIASTTIYLNAELATNNKTHFQKIPGLRFFEPDS